MRRPGTAEVEYDVVVDLLRRGGDRSFELLKSRAWHKGREIGDLLFASNRQRDRFRAGVGDDRQNLRGERLAISS